MYVNNWLPKGNNIYDTYYKYINNVNTLWKFAKIRRKHNELYQGPNLKK